MNNFEKARNLTGLLLRFALFFILNTIFNKILINPIYLLTNCKKHCFEGSSEENVLPLGVKCKGDKYYGEIQFIGTGKQIKISEWNTAEEAFAEYKVMKQADILMVAAQYEESIPNYIYEKLLKVEVKEY